MVNDNLSPSAHPAISTYAQTAATESSVSGPATTPIEAAASNGAAIPNDASGTDDLDTPSGNLADYNPDDYRWVPVRRRPRYDGWTEEKQRRFIEMLADTGIVTAAAKAVGMSRESANRLRRSPHGAAFARAWDAARHHAGSVLEDIAFERAIEGIEHNVYDEYGEIICTKRVYNDRLLTFLLSNLKPERYGRHPASQPPAAPPIEPLVELDASLRDMEAQLPAPAEALLVDQTLQDELEIAEMADGVLPGFLSEQRPQKSAARIEAEAFGAQQARGKAACEKQGERSDQEFKDMCAYLDPAMQHERGKKRFR